MQTPALIEELARETGSDTFEKDPPNAVFSTFLKGKQPTAATVILVEKPIVEGSSVSFPVVLQDGEIPAEFGPASLFIDHWSGGHHHRRGKHKRRAHHRRRGVAEAHDDSHPGAALVTGLVVGAAVTHVVDSKRSSSSSSANQTSTNTTSKTQATSAAQQNAYVQTSPAPTATPEQRLEEAKDMRDEGLITDSEYEAKKQEVLEDM